VDRRRVEAPDGRFWSVRQLPGVRSVVVEAATEALPCEQYRWRVSGYTRMRAAVVQVAQALRSGEEPTPEGATLLSHVVEAPELPPTGNVHVV
jgi:hypothetical protein